jgi:hypothetical protein
MTALQTKERRWSGYIIRIQRAAEGWHYTVRDEAHAGEGWLASGGGFRSEAEAFEDGIAAVIELERRRAAVHDP